MSVAPFPAAGRDSDDAGRAPLTAADIFAPGRRDDPMLARMLRKVADGHDLPAEQAMHQTELTIAREFALAHADRLRFDHRRGAFMVYRDPVFVEDVHGEASRMLQAFLDDHVFNALALENRKQREEVTRAYLKHERAVGIRHLLELVQVQDGIAMRGDEWDADPMLLAVANGVLDLRTSIFSAGRADDLLTRRAGVLFDRAAECPRWRRFLTEVFEDVDTIDVVHRAVGYTLTAQTTEQVLFILHGRGSNGKSVFLAVLRALLGSYASNLPFSSLMRKRDHGGESPASDLATLPNVRLVTASEVREQGHIDEARLKAVTGGDPITCRHLFRKWFTFTPAFKLWLAVNHLPKVSDDSHGYWRRVRVLPCRRSFDGADRDDHLLEKLLKELPGILNWALAGAVRWQREGLGESAPMQAEAAEWRNENDVVSAFLRSDTVALIPEARARAAHLYEAFCVWADRERLDRDERLSRTAFGSRMKAHVRARVVGGYVTYFGIGVRVEGVEG